MLYIVLFFAALLALLFWTRKSPGPLPRDKIAAKYTPCKKPKKPPKKRYSKNNITTQVNRKSPVLVGCFVLRCFRDRRTITGRRPARPDPALHPTKVAENQPGAGRGEKIYKSK